MKWFYIPDGHRRYALREGVPLREVYEIGYHVLRDEIVRPLCSHARVTRVCVFLLSTLNLQRRSGHDLDELLKALDVFVPRLCADCAPFATVRLFGRRSGYPLSTDGVAKPYLDLFIESDIEDEFPDGPADIFLRSGSGLRLAEASALVRFDEHRVLGRAPRDQAGRSG
jgi:hypothetical protein